MRGCGKRLLGLMTVCGMLGFTHSAMASAFQLWEQNAASVGNYHAGRAVSANDASTAFENPAGLIRIPNQQLVLGAVTVLPDIKYNGTVGVNTIGGGVPAPVSAQGGRSAFVPDLHYAAPISDRFTLGFSVDAPFGLQTEYSKETFMRYAATRSYLRIADYSLSLGFKVTEKFSGGVGLDVQNADAKLNQAGGFQTPILDTQSLNTASDTGDGFFLGLLYQFTPDTRLGFSYHSQIVHHLTGKSAFVGPLATSLVGGPLISPNLKADLTVPPYSTLGAYHKFNRWALMGSLTYTQWTKFNKSLILQNVAGIAPSIIPTPSIGLTIVDPEHYRNSWNLSVGADYFVNDRVTLRGALGFDQTPLNSKFRDVRLPDGNRVALALGTHLQATKTIGFDLGWTHLFIDSTTIKNPPIVTGAQVTTTRGSVKSNADVFGVQLTWDIV